ncbi:hypothetical protein ACFY05_31940 [Microtetraspora fusca]|uniref:Uncharacterized protein n=1 Tax=Microtetraspora fusca TaxID=1997 RepID=A0ABW6VDU8_MICFU
MTCVINARDFCSDTTDPLRDRWSVGKLHHVIKALDGARVAVTVARGTGTTLLDAVLKSTSFSGSYACGEVLIATTVSNGTEQQTRFPVVDLGMILPLDDTTARDAKWIALDSYREQGSKAITTAQDLYAESTGRQWGSWKAEPLDATRVHVRYTPSTGNPYFADKWGERGFWTITT